MKELSLLIASNKSEIEYDFDTEREFEQSHEIAVGEFSFLKNWNHLNEQQFFGFKFENVHLKTLDTYVGSLEPGEFNSLEEFVVTINNKFKQLHSYTNNHLKSQFTNLPFIEIKDSKCFVQRGYFDNEPVIPIFNFGILKILGLSEKFYYKKDSEIKYSNAYFEKYPLKNRQNDYLTNADLDNGKNFAYIHCNLVHTQTVDNLYSQCI